MSDEGNGLDLLPGVDAPDLARGSSVLQELARRREETLEDETVLLSIPTWGGSLKARYRVVPRVELDKVLKENAKRQKDRAGSSDADMNFLARACIGIVACPDEDLGQGDETEVPVSSGYNQELADALGKPELDSAKKLIAHMFKGNGIAIASHSMKVAKWMQDTSLTVEDEADPS